jgi:hypothetical protein
MLKDLHERSKRSSKTFKNVQKGVHRLLRTFKKGVQRRHESSKTFKTLKKNVEEYLKMFKMFLRSKVFTYRSC